MTSNECLKNICLECEKEKGKNKIACPFRSISNDYCYEVETIEKDLDRLEELRYSYEIATSKLKIAIEIILKYKINPSTFIFTRKIYKESCGKDLTFEKAHSLLEFDGTQEEYNLLKEVLEE